MSQPKSFFDKQSKISSKSSGNFPFLQVQVAQWQKLTQMIQPFLPSQGKWQVVCYQNNVLTIAGDNQALISQLRYLQQQYVQNFKEAIPALSSLENLQVILQDTTKVEPISKKYTRKKQFSTSTQQELQGIAQIVKDPKLSQALLRLASSEPED